MSSAALVTDNMSCMGKRKTQNKRYFVKEDDGIFIVKDEFFKAIESRAEALVVCMRTYFELQKRLKEDAVDGDVSYIGNMKVTTGLERSLNELNRLYPGLLDELRSVDRRYEGTTIYKC